jgi:hypothetical protein
MVLNSRSSKGGDTAFDFSSSASVMLILKALRTHAEVTTAVRNEIRDLIFSYTNGKGDDAVRQTIEGRLLAVGITPEGISTQKSEAKAPVAPIKEAPKAGFSGGRVAPSFVPTSVLTGTAPVPTPASPEPKPVVAQEVAPAEPVATEVSPTSSIPKIVPTIPTMSATSAGTHDVVKKSVTNDQVPFAQTPSSLSKTPTEVSKSASFDTTEMLERIRVIKADVNARVGNPVNLVSINNTIGREYMSSLLEAMKQLGSGNAPTITTAMKRLEISYEQALSVIEMAQAPTPTPTPTPNNPVVQAETQAQSAPVIPPVPSAQPTPPTPPTPSAVPTPPLHNPPLGVTRTVARPAPVVPTPQTPPPPPAPPAPPVPPVHRAPTVPIAPPVGSKPATRVQMSASPAEVMQASEPPSAVPIHSSKFAPAQSVAMATPLRKVEELPTLAEVKNRSESGNPLYTGEISEGLEQLLSEWTIFRKSGVFGTGPKGSNHPLFKKLAGLKIPLIIAGRFEGATEEVRQSITDYMNGWRYEQGIVYEKEETFEDYLRRVIKHILDQQDN